MKRYVGVLANTLLDQNQVRLSEEVIKDILEKQPQVPVTVNFGKSAIGTTESYSLEKDQLVVHFNIAIDMNDDALALVEQAFSVPGMTNVKFHKEGETRVVDSGDLNEVSISLFPANSHLKQITKKEKHGRQ